MAHGEAGPNTYKSPTLRTTKMPSIEVPLCLEFDWFYSLYVFIVFNYFSR